MALSAVLFYVLAALAGGSAVCVVVSRNLVRAAVGLLFTLLSVAVLYFLLGAEFLGAVQMMVYVGGTLVLVVFGIMMTSTGPTQGERVTRLEWLLGLGLAVGLFLALAGASLTLAKPATPAGELPGVRELGLGFLGMAADGSQSYLLPFEIVSVHLLVVLVAAAYLARGKKCSDFRSPASTSEIQPEDFRSRGRTSEVGKAVKP
jgi:NADH-quinone oxidoreductase subunit J